AIMAASSTTVTRPSTSFIAANGVTAPGSMPSVSRMRSAEPKENRPDAPRRRCNDFSSMTASSSALTRNSVSFLSRRNRFLVCPPGMVPRKTRDCSTVNNAGCVTVWCAMPSRSRKPKRSDGVAGMSAERSTNGVNRWPSPFEGRLRRPPQSDGSRESLRHLYCESLIDGGEHLIEAGEHHDFDQPLLSPLCDRLRLQIVGADLPRGCFGHNRVGQRVGLRQRGSVPGTDAINDIGRQAGGARVR